MAKFDFGWSKSDFSELRAIDPDFDKNYEADPFYIFDPKFDDCSTDVKAPEMACGTDVKWLWNGIKVDGKLHRAHYSMGTVVIEGETKGGYVSVYARDLLVGLPRLVGESVVNRSDSQTDYFERDHMRIAPDSRHYNAAVAAYEAQEKHREKKCAKREAKRESVR